MMNPFDDSRGSADPRKEGAVSRLSPQRIWVLGAETLPHARIITNRSTRVAYHYPEVGAVEYVRADLVRELVGYWDALDTVATDDPRPTEDFKSEMDRRIDALR